jgi:hypothetical protein
MEGILASPTLLAALDNHQSHCRYSLFRAHGRIVSEAISHLTVMPRVTFCALLLAVLVPIRSPNLTNGLLPHNPAQRFHLVIERSHCAENFCH